MNEVLYKLCCHCVSITDGWIPYPSTVLAESCKLSLYQTRKELKKLKEQGLVVSDRYCERTEEGNLIINGYTVTDKAKHTEEYKKAWKWEKETVKEIFGYDIGEIK